MTDAAGEVTIEVPRGRAGTFSPVIVKKRQRRLSDVDGVAISLYAKGLTTAGIGAHFAEVRGASVSRDTISRITDKAVEEVQGWSGRPVQGVCAAIFIDAIYVRVRDGQVGNQPFHAAIGVDPGGRRDVLGLWAGKGGGESAKFWTSVPAALKNRGDADAFFVVRDGLKGLPDAVNAVLPAAIVQACVIHLIRATLRYASRKYWDQIARGPAGDLHRPHRPGGLGGVRRPRGEVGQALPGDPQALARGVGGAHPFPGPRRRDPTDPISLPTRSSR